LKQEDNAAYNVPVNTLCVWDSGAALPTAAAADDLAVIAGTWGTDTLHISAGDCKTITATRYGRFAFTLPVEYVAGQTVTVRLNSGMLTTAADGSCTLDVEAYKVGSAVVSGSDLVATAAVSMNSTTFANRDFVLTSSGLSPGDTIDVRIKIACVDTATATAVKPTIASVKVLCDVKG
jgi:hypothetical protein